MKVEATRTGHYNHRRYKEGQQFSIAKPVEFSAAWMRPVDDPAKAGKEWASEIAFKQEQFEKRKSPEQLRREALEARAKADAGVQASAIAAAVGTAVGTAVEQALAVQREEHAKFLREGGGGKPTK